MAPVNLIIVGAGSRGARYASFALESPIKAKVVGVAEPRSYYRTKLADDHKIPVENVFSDWKELAKRPKFADAVIIATHDSMHAEPAIAFSNVGYNILLEKPMAPTLDECQLIANSISKNKVLCAVCHVLRYTDYTQQLKSILDSGKIGEIVSVQHLEPVGYWHQAHSFVRGNWSNEKKSTFMLLAKCCHDVDWLKYIVGSRCIQVSSFGNLKYFRKENKPADAAQKCLDCACEPKCPYSAVKIYLRDRAEKGLWDCPVDILTSNLTIQGLKDALRHGPYGRCVYECDNDVVDHQVVNMAFESGATASFTMTAFTEGRDRVTRIFGTYGELYCDGSQIRIYDFLTNNTELVEIKKNESSTLAGHGGGDGRIMERFVTAVATEDQGLILSSAAESLASHKIVFAAEMARRSGTVEEVH
jgi:predicted dehydrogenase